MEVVFPHPEVTRPVRDDRIERGEVLGDGYGSVSAANHLGTLPRHRPDSRDVGVDIVVGDRARLMVQADDPGERAVMSERLQLVAARGTDDDKAAPQLQDPGSFEDLAEQASVRGDVRLQTRVRPQQAVHLALAIPELHHDGVLFFPGPPDEHPAVACCCHRPPEEPARFAMVRHGEGASMIALGIEDRDGRTRSVPCGDRVARPRPDALKVLEFAGSFAAPSTR